MDPVRNPFAPGAGNRPPELAGREPILDEAKVAIRRALIGKASRSQMLLGLRGVGKTVLLNKIQEMAEAEGHVTSFIEAPQLGSGPYRSADVAERSGESHQSLGPRRSQIISKGMIYSPSHGDIAFTVPMFNEYLIRNFVK